MKTLSKILLFSLINTTASAIAAPVFEPVGSSTFNFGTISSGDHVEHSFRFRNSGNDSLIIGDVKGSCGCTAALASVKRLGPGQTGEIKADFNSAGKSGKQNKTITVNSNDPNRSAFVFTLEGMISEPITLSPGSFSLRAKPNEVVTERMTVTNNTDKPVKLGTIHYPDAETAPIMTLTVEPKTIPAGGAATATITFNAKTPGRLFKTFTVETDNAKAPTLTLRVNTFVEEAKPASPAVGGTK